MTKIYFIRHCEAMGNVNRVFQGHTDSDISPRGGKQLECLSDRFKDFKFDNIYSSPLIRAYKTAMAVAGDKNIEVIKRENLIELYGGFVENQKFEKIFSENPDLADIWHNRPQDFAPRDGEPMRNGYERIWQETLSLAGENKGKTIAVATHGGVIRLLLCRLFFHDIERLIEVPWSENTAVTLIEFDNALTPTVSILNDTSHLKPELRSAFLTDSGDKK